MPTFKSNEHIFKVTLQKRSRKDQKIHYQATIPNQVAERESFEGIIKKDGDTITLIIM